MSLGTTFDRVNAGGGGSGPLIAALNRAINYATAAGTLCISSAGNEGVNLNSMIWSIPAQSGNGMAVAATGPIDFYNLGNSAIFDRPASYTNYGQSVVNVAAPGGDYTLYPASIYRYDMVISPGAGAIQALSTCISLRAHPWRRPMSPALRHSSSASTAKCHRPG